MEGAAIYGRCWLGVEVGSCCPLPNAKGQGGSSGGRYSAGACGVAQCVDLAFGCARGPIVTSCSAAMTVSRLVPVLSTCAGGLTVMSCS